MSKVTWKSGTFIYPLPAVMVSCGTMEESNIITVAWTGIINTDPAMCYISVRPTKEKANFVNCPMIKESPVSVECKVKEIRELGSHHMFVAEILGINADEKYINENGAFDISKCDLIAYSNGNYYSLGKKIGRFGFSVQKKKKTAKKSGKTIDKKRKK